MPGFREFKPLAILAGVCLAVLLGLLLLAGCEGDDTTVVYYPHDTTHGYYDTHHHYHYYPKYGNGRHTVTVKPNPKSGNVWKAPSRPRSGFGSSTRRR